MTGLSYDVPDDASLPALNYDVRLEFSLIAKYTPSGRETAINLLGACSLQGETASSSDALPESLRNNWQRLATSGLSDELYHRIRMIANKQAGWRGHGSHRLSAGSLRHFLNFWRMVKDYAVEPFVTLAPNGHLYAEWHASWKRHLDVEFTDNGDVFYGLFHGNKIHEGREAGSELAKMFRARRHNPFMWGG